MKNFKAIVALLAFGAALTAQAATINFSYTADNANGSINGGGNFGPTTVVISLTGDTTASAACTIRGQAGNCIPATSGTVTVGAGAATTITVLTNLNICATSDGSWVGVCNMVDANTYSVGNVSASSGGVVNLNATAGPFAYAAGATHTHPSFAPGTPLFSVAAGTFALFDPEGSNTAASNVSWTVGSTSASAFIPAKTNVPYVAGVALQTALDMAGGSGPSVSTCLIPAIQQLLGGSAVYLGQSNSGQVSISWNGQAISFFPLDANSGSSQPASLSLQGNNPLAMVTSCGTLFTAPAPFNLDQFGSALNRMGLTAFIDQKGVIAINVNGTVYVARPDYLVTSGSSYPPGISLGADGMYRFANAEGTSQILRPAFLDPVGLASAVGGSVVIQTDGTAIQSIGGQRWLLVPDLTLGSVPTDHVIDFSAWQDGTNRYRYRVQNVKPFPQNLFQFTYSQGFTRTIAP